MIGEKTMKKIISIVLISILFIGIIPIDSTYASTNYTTYRHAGSSRYDTSFAVCDALAKVKGGKFDNIVVACGSNFPDALSGGYLTNVKNAPMLLINQAQESVVLQYINKYMKSGGTVYILGGTSVVRKAFETTLKNKRYKVKRLAGSGRYDTNLDILKEVTPEVKKHGTLLVSTGTNFADSLSASSVPYPIMLVGNSLNSEQKNWIKSTGIKKIYILGGTGAVNKTIETELKKYGTVERISGNTRYDTSIAIANKFYPNAKYITLVYGANFPDGLSGAPMAAHYGSPIVLVSANNYAHARNYVLAKDIWTDITIGGTSVVSNKTIDNIMKRTASHTHNYGNPNWVWTNYTKAIAKFTCSCGDTQSVNATIINVVKKQATCSNNGQVEYTATAKFNNKTYTNVRNQTLQPTGHNYTWTSDNTQHWHKCTRCSATDTKVNHTWTTVTKPTCTMGGSDKCSTCGKTRTTSASHTWTKVEFYDNTFDEMLDNNVITWNNDGYWGWKSDRVFSYPPTHTEKGLNVFYCKKCKSMKREDVHKLTTHIHEWDWIYDWNRDTWKYDSTKHWRECTKAGCNRTNYEFEHIYEQWEIVKEPTATASGSMQRKCYYCNYKQTKAIPAGHMHTWEHKKTKYKELDIKVNFETDIYISPAKIFYWCDCGHEHRRDKVTRMVDGVLLENVDWAEWHNAVSKRAIVRDEGITAIKGKKFSQIMFSDYDGIWCKYAGMHQASTSAAPEYHMELYPETKVEHLFMVLHSWEHERDECSSCKATKNNKTNYYNVRADYTPGVEYPYK